MVWWSKGQRSETRISAPIYTLIQVKSIPQSNMLPGSTGCSGFNCRPMSVMSQWYLPHCWGIMGVFIVTVAVRCDGQYGLDFFKIFSRSWNVRAEALRGWPTTRNTFSLLVFHSWGSDFLACFYCYCAKHILVLIKHGQKNPTQIQGWKKIYL